MKTPLEEAIKKVKKEILTLEWDIPHIKSESLRAKKQSKLDEYRTELSRLNEEQIKEKKLNIAG